ncbi:hypothetical protein H6P81_011412 [Aristolochia fimbriata]|uniref:Pectinesterase inhibitor domain-containing protein n=1 Tax=Aristolochia fimbriata TaxID=158543 RepID=A0AAV7ERF1_ARIFI|nr:hypothetical protein H6P81_011412 [Aristolochia fimbriata]
MARYVQYCALFVVFLFWCSTESLEIKEANTIQEACNKITKDTPVVDAGLCVSSLSSDPRSARADPATLARIAIDVARANGSDTVYFILGLRDRESDNARRTALTSCADYYGVTVFNGLATVLAKLGPSGPVEKVQKKVLLEKIQFAVDAGPNCNNYFEAPGKPGNIDPELKRRNAVAFQLCAAAYGLTFQYVAVKP